MFVGLFNEPGQSEFKCKGSLPKNVARNLKLKKISINFRSERVGCDTINSCRLSVATGLAYQLDDSENLQLTCKAGLCHKACGH